MNQFVALLIALTATGYVGAQTVTFSALNPAVAQASLNGQTQAMNQAAGPVPFTGYLGAVQTIGSTDYSFISTEWDLRQTPWGVYLSFYQSASTQSATPVSASLTASDFLLQVTNATPMGAQLRLARSPRVAAGGATNLLQIDIGNDGTIDFSESSVGSTLTLPVALGPVPVTLRIHNVLAVQGSASIGASMQIELVPTANTTIAPGGIACSPAHSQSLLPTFGGDLRVGIIRPLMSSSPSVVVFGFSPLPTLLPTPQPGPCLLLPSPDVLMFTPTNQPLLVTLPPAVRPVTFWTQVIVLEPNGLTTTNGARVDAN